MKFDVLFSPHGGCEAAIVAAIKKATKSIYVLSYTFTSKPIADALIEKHKAGVPVFFIGDENAMKGPGCRIHDLYVAGIVCYVDGTHAIAHNKIMIIDLLLVLGGSFNHSSAAENRNGENLTIVADALVAAKYQANWDLHRSHSILYVPVVTSGAAPFEFDPSVETELSQQ